MRPRADHLQDYSDAVRWHIFHFVGDADLAAVACANQGLLGPCASARLYIHVVRLNARHPSLLALPRRLCPGAGAGWSARDEKSIQQALEGLARGSDRGDPAAMALVLPWIQRGNAIMRAIAIRSVSKIAAQGDRRAIDEVLRCLGEARAISACCDALKALVVKGDPEVVSRVKALVRNVVDSVRCAGLSALSSVVERGDLEAVALARGYLVGPSDMVRASAMLALGRLAREGDLGAMEEMIRGLKDPSHHVRRAAMASLHVTSGGSFAASAEAAEAAETLSGAYFALPMSRAATQEPADDAFDDFSDAAARAVPKAPASQRSSRHHWQTMRRGQRVS